MRLYAIGDIHGQREMLRAAHARVAADRDVLGDMDAPLVHLGDLTDRGPDSAGVITDLIAGVERGEPWEVIRGNHDQMFLDFLNFEDHDDPLFDMAEFWLRPNLGGPATLASYGVEMGDNADPKAVQEEALKAIPGEHISFLNSLPLYYETEDLFCVHAGIRPGVPLHEQAKDDLIWIRYEFLDDSRDHGKLIIHGHTPAEQPEHHGNRVNLDTGAGYGRPMTAAVFEGRDAWVLTNSGRVVL
ncbi:metallophosphoesterase family protein [Pseudoruegeria sp. HB172150]|uniref:metallophosphoesterase family protein n=1 Tax=Pseudoruegeria sp. HB172150 TaxID=2721164 RepID=UPI001554249F|nr:metallophosphoesterase family protein [Pseudoruegeria sp. HB172150]